MADTPTPRHELPAIRSTAAQGEAKRSMAGITAAFARSKTIPTTANAPHVPKAGVVDESLFEDDSPAGAAPAPLSHTGAVTGTMTLGELAARVGDDAGAKPRKVDRSKLHEDGWSPSEVLHRTKAKDSKPQTGASLAAGALSKLGHLRG